jgi:hypothetical protein
MTNQQLGQHITNIGKIIEITMFRMILKIDKIKPTNRIKVGMVMDRTRK